MDMEEIAKVVYEVNRAYCRSLGDFNQRNWEMAPDWQKDDAIADVKLVLNNPELHPQSIHEAWMQRRFNNGWVYGEKRDRHANPPTEYCLVDYDELRQEVKSQYFILKSLTDQLSKSR